MRPTVWGRTARLLLVAAVCWVGARGIPLSLHPTTIQHDHLAIGRAVNLDPSARWVAGVNRRFLNVSADFLKSQTGVLLGGKPSGLPLLRDVASNHTNPPDAFDARTKWGKGCPSVAEIRDQGACGGSWAFGAVEAMTDRLCIHSNGSVQAHIAAEDVLSCCGFHCGNGCEGGFPSAAWRFLQTEGAVTGGQFASHEGCMPYPMDHCSHTGRPHSDEGGDYPPCHPALTPQCQQECAQGYNVSYHDDKHHTGEPYILSGVSDIEKDIMLHGPVQAMFLVFEDLLTYKSGVYHHVTGDPLGAHAAKLLGWGVDATAGPYWIVANSWNTEWGDDGFFKIRKGSDECGIESMVMAAKSA